MSHAIESQRLSQLVTLDKKAHRNLKIDTLLVDALGRRERLVPVVLSEFLKLVVHYPIVLTKNGETGRFVCMAMLGFIEGENLFWRDNKWDGIYTPLNISRQPFFLGANGEREPLICVDTASPCISGKGEALFDEQGRETDFMQRIKQMLAALMHSERDSQQFIDTLNQHHLIVPLALDITFADGNSHHVKGLYSIDEDKLNALPTAARDELFARGYLKPIYVMIASLAHLYSLIQRKNERLAAQ